MFSRSFIYGSAERAIKTICQSLLSVWTLGAFNVFSIDFRAAFGVALGAGALSILTSVVSQPFGDPNSPSVLTYGRHARKVD